MIIHIMSVDLSRLAVLQELERYRLPAFSRPARRAPQRPKCELIVTPVPGLGGLPHLEQYWI